MGQRARNVRGSRRSGLRLGFCERCQQRFRRIGGRGPEQGAALRARDPHRHSGDRLCGLVATGGGQPGRGLRARRRAQLPDAGLRGAIGRRARHDFRPGVQRSDSRGHGDTEGFSGSPPGPRGHRCEWPLYPGGALILHRRRLSPAGLWRNPQRRRLQRRDERDLRGRRQSGAGQHHPDHHADRAPGRDLRGLDAG